MSTRYQQTEGATRRKGAVVVQVALLGTVLFAFAALAIDIGYLYNVKSELQRSADSGALAGAMQYADVSSAYGDSTIFAKLDNVRNGAKAYVAKNPAGGKEISLETDQIVLGYLSDPYDRSLPIDTSNPPDFNVIQVTTRRTADSVNGPVGLFFAGVLGKSNSNVTATSVAVLDDRFSGITVSNGSNGPLIPFVLKATEWDDQVVNGGGMDLYSVNENGNVIFFGDGIPEVQLFIQEGLGPDNGNGNGNGNDNNDGAGNYGILNIGVFNNSEAIVEDQILDGITGEQIYDEFGSNTLNLYTPDGSPLSYPVTGNPGIKAGMKDELEDRLGEVVGFFVYDELLGGTGNNTTFNIVGIQFGRIMSVELTGNDKKVIVQPAAYVGSNIETSEDAPSTNGLIAKLSLIR